MKPSLTLVLFIGCLAIANHTSHAQAPDIEWDKTYGRSDFDYLEAIEQTDDGGYIVGGYSWSSGFGTIGWNYWVLKLSASGNLEWEKTIGGSNWDQLYSLQQTVDGGFILGGWSRSNTSGDKSEDSKDSNGDYWVVKLTSDGDVEWDKTIGGRAGDLLASLHQTSDGGYILGGRSLSGAQEDKSEQPRGGLDYWVVKLTESGNIEWDKTIGGVDDDWLTSVRQTNDGGYIVGGRSRSDASGDKSEDSNEGSHDYWVVKLTNTGDIEWEKTIGGPGIDQLESVLQVDDGKYLAAGSSRTVDGDDDFWIVKLTEVGNLEWEKSIGGQASDQLSSIQMINGGGYIAGGTSFSNISGNKSDNTRGRDDYWVVKLTNEGDVEWDKTIGGFESDQLTSIQQTNDGGYILGGRSNSDISGDKSENGNGAMDYWIVKLSAEVEPDVIAPIVITSDLVIDLDMNGEVAITPQDIDNGSTDNDGIALYALDKSDFTCADLGENIITLTVTDHSGNIATGTAKVTVEDNLTPKASAKDITVQLDGSGNALIEAADIDDGSTDNCSFTLSINANAFDCDNVGINEVVLTVTDGAGNSATALTNVTVVDELPPVINGKDITVELDLEGHVEISVEDIDNGTADNCALESLTLDKTAFDRTMLGTNEVTLTATDVHGNMATQAFVVTVNENALIVSVEDDPENTQDFIITSQPNPFSHSTTLQITSAISRKLQFIIYDTRGRHIKHAEVNLAADMHQMEIGAALGSGTYLVRFHDPITQRQQYLRLVKL